MSDGTAAGSVLRELGSSIADLATLYTDFHSHPELSMQERRTARVAAARLRAAGFEVTEGVGNTGVVGLLRNAVAATRTLIWCEPVFTASGLRVAQRAACSRQRAAGQAGDGGSERAGVPVDLAPGAAS